MLPRIKTKNPSIEGGDGCPVLSLPVDRCRCVIVQRWMEPFTVVQRKGPPQALNRVRPAARILERDRLLLHTAPAPFHHDVIEDSPPSIQAEEPPTRQPRLGPRQARELDPWIGVEAVRRRPDQSTLKGGGATMAIHGHRYLPRQHSAALPVPHGHQVHQALGPSPGGDVRRPDVVGPSPAHPRPSRGRPRCPCTRFAQAWCGRHGREPPLPPHASPPLGMDRSARPMPPGGQAPHPRHGAACVGLIQPAPQGQMFSTLRNRRVGQPSTRHPASLAWPPLPAPLGVRFDPLPPGLKGGIQLFCCASRGQR